MQSRVELPSKGTGGYSLPPVGNKPEGVAFSPDSAIGYVTNTGDGTLTVIAGLPVLPPSTTAPAPSLSKAIAATL